MKQKIFMVFLSAALMSASSVTRAEEMSFSVFAELKSGSESFGEMVGLAQACEAENNRSSEISNGLIKRFRNIIEFTGADFAQMNLLDSTALDSAAKVRGSRDWVSVVANKTTSLSSLYDCNRGDVCCVVLNGFPKSFGDRERRQTQGDGSILPAGAINIISTMPSLSYF